MVGAVDSLIIFKDTIHVAISTSVYQYHVNFETFVKLRKICFGCDCATCYVFYHHMEFVGKIVEFL